MSDDDRQRLLAIYLNDHLAGATAGCRRLERAAHAHAGTPAGPVLARVGAECREDRRALLRAMRAAGVRRRWSLLLAARVGEGLGALKPNGRVVRRSPLSTVVELEGLSLAVAGKVAGWVSLRELSRSDDRWSQPALTGLVERARQQHGQLEDLRRRAVVEVLGAGPTGPRLAPVAG